MTRHIIQNASEDSEGRRTAPAALRNTGPLIATLGQRLPTEGRVLEIASGTGQHAAAFAEAFRTLDWVPSDVDAEQRDSIAAWRRESGLANLFEPLALDVAAPWPVTRGFAGAVLAINLLHLIPVSFVTLLFEQAIATLSGQGRLIIYGPFKRGTDFASDGDRNFDASLRERDPAIGYKSVEDVSGIATDVGFTLVAKDEMPANNLLLTFASP
ncbi:MAG: DUF938 domain-containing protein [Paracoccaceae bacterium]